MNVLPDLALALQRRLGLELPGELARGALSPPHRPILDENEIKSRNPFIASVLILLFPDGKSDHPSFILMERSNDGTVHSGQISLPGGRQEFGESPLDAALREAQEEIGVDTNSVHVIGQLSRLYVPPSNFLVNPFVGWINERPKLIPNPQEVNRLISLNIGPFIQPDSIVLARVSASNGQVLNVPAFQIEEHLIWGATAMMLAELFHIYSEVKLEKG